MTHGEMRALIHNQMAETARLSAQQVEMRSGALTQRVMYNPFTYAAGLSLLVPLLAKYVIPWMLR